MSYTHLSPVERYQIAALLKAGHRAGQIAQVLGRHRSSIYRELRRGAVRGQYFPWASQDRADDRAQASRNARTISSGLWAKVRDRLLLQHSPEQIAGCLTISHEAIYQRVYADYRQGGSLFSHLRRAHKRRKKRSWPVGTRSWSTPRRSIAQRPVCVEHRAQVGHWELDTIVGPAHQQAIVTIVERKSGYVRLMKVPDLCAATVSQAIIDLLTPFKARVYTLTSDNGKEFAAHARLDQALDCISYFADPCCPWQRGTNENTNGLVRQYVPKKHSLLDFDHEDIEQIEFLLNHRPRKRLGYQTPHQVFFQSFNRVALRA